MENRFLQSQWQAIMSRHVCSVTFVHRLDNLHMQLRGCNLWPVVREQPAVLDNWNLFIRKVHILGFYFIYHMMKFDFLDHMKMHDESFNYDYFWLGVLCSVKKFYVWVAELSFFTQHKYFFCQGQDFLREALKPSRVEVSVTQNRNRPFSDRQPYNFIKFVDE